nr:hypothetical protein [Tanacetum cinerariifolium]
MNQNFYNFNSSGSDQTQPLQFPVIHPPPQETSIEILHDQENAINCVQTFLRKFNRYSFFETPKVLLLAWDRVFEIKNAFGNKQYKPEDMQDLFRKLFNDVQNIHEELPEYINTPGWNRPAFYNNDDDDDVDYTIAITPASPYDSELVSLEVVEIVIPEDEEIKDDNLREKLLNVHLLIAKIEALKENPTPSSEFLTKSSSTSPKSFLEQTNTFNNSLPEFENFCFYLEEISSGSTTTHSDIYLPDYEAFHFDDNHIKEISSGIEDDHSLLLTYVVWIFLAYLTYPVIPPYLYSVGNEDTIFDPGIAINHFYSFKPGLSYRCGTFKKFNTHRSHLNESLMEMLFSTCFLMD